ncbi:MAG: branched-chain amino acid ABC transporter permease [Deltaproteobacteria bacterium]|nr:branched-chain amino acid ABC transporter permease [Deltaproteobacteria bacterium]
MLLNILINGLIVGGMYALLAVGFALIFSVARILNMAHTAFYMVSAYVIYIGSSMLHLSLFPSIVMAIFVTVILGILCFYLFFDRVKEHEFAVMIIAVALASSFQEILLLIFGGTILAIPPLAEGFYDIGGTNVSYQHIFAFLLSALILIVLWIVLSKTKLGSAIRAVAQDSEIANLMGISVRRVYVTVMAISIGLAAVSAAVMGPIYMISPMMWGQPLVIVLAAVVLGGEGSIGGAVIAAFILGYAESIVVFMVPGGAFLGGAASMAVMVLVLLVKPEGLFGVLFEEERL